MAAETPEDPTFAIPSVPSTDVATTAATPPATGPEPVAEPEPEAEPEPHRYTAADIRRIRNRATTRDWLNITRKVGVTRAEIEDDEGLLLCALAYLRDVQDHGGGRIDLYLDMPEEEMAAKGFPIDSDDLKRVREEQATAEGKEPA